MWWLQSLSLSGGGEAEWRKTTIKEREMSPRDWQLCRQGGKKKKIPCTPFRVHSQKDKHHLICKRLPFGDDKKKKKNVAGRNTYMEIARSCAENLCDFLSSLCSWTPGQLGSWFLQTVWWTRVRGWFRLHPSWSHLLMSCRRFQSSQFLCVF